MRYACSVRYCAHGNVLVDQELDKLVSFSGTPTLAWRRTGEICLVGPEFCMLTGWEKEELIGRKKYVYEVRAASNLDCVLC